MDKKVQLKHPKGKKAIRMPKAKYDLLKPMVVKYLRSNGNATFSAMTSAIAKEFKTNGTKFEGSIPWHLEWVKLDLEARKIIKRVPNTSPIEYVNVRRDVGCKKCFRTP